MTRVTRARVMPSRRAMAAWLRTSPDSRRVCHLSALRRSSAARGGLISRHPGPTSLCRDRALHGWRPSSAVWVPTLSCRTTGEHQSGSDHWVAQRSHTNKALRWSTATYKIRALTSGSAKNAPGYDEVYDWGANVCLIDWQRLTGSTILVRGEPVAFMI